MCVYGRGGSKVTETQGGKGRDAKGGQTSQRTQRKGRGTESPGICSWRQRDETETQKETIRETWRQEPEVYLTLLKSCHRLSYINSLTPEEETEAPRVSVTCPRSHKRTRFICPTWSWRGKLWSSSPSCSELGSGDSRGGWD